MDDQRSASEESPRVRGLLYLWRGYSSSVAPERVLLTRPVLQAALGISHGILLAEGGLVFSFGELPWKQDLKTPPTDPLLESALSGRGVVSVAAGSFHCGAVTQDGTLYMWGENSSGQCGLLESGLVSDPRPVNLVDSDTLPPQVTRVLEVACGEHHTLALSAQHEVWAWGSGCQLGLVTSVFPVRRPQKVEHLAGRHVLQVACGGFHSLALVKHVSPQDSTWQADTGKCGECNQQLLSMFDKEDHVIINNSHYCPLGVELVNTRPGPWSGQASRSDTEATSNVLPNGRGPATLTSKDSLPAQQQALRRTKSSPYPGEDELKDYLKRRSRHTRSLMEHPYNTQAGDLLASVDRGSGDPIIFTDTLGVDCSFATMEGAACAAPYQVNSAEDTGSTSSLCESSKSEGCVPGPRANHTGSVTASREGKEEACRFESKHMKASSSLTGFLLDEVMMAGRRHSLPPLPSHVSEPYFFLPASSALPSRRTTDIRPPTMTRKKEEVAESLPSLNTEVWTWGRGQEGQLGHGDQLPRLQPLCIKTLNGEEVVKVAAGTHHSLAVTAQCQVITQHSQAVTMSEGLRVWDVAAGQDHSVFLADGDCCQPILCYSGQQVSTFSLAPLGQYSSPGSSRSMGYISSVCGGGGSCLALADHNVMGFISGLHELAAADRKFYCRLRDIQKRSLADLCSNYVLESLSTVLGKTSSLLFQSLADSHNRLCHLMGQHSVSMTAFLHGGRDVKSLVILKQASTFLDTYKEYCSSVGNFLVMGVLLFNLLEVLRHLSECSADKVSLGDLLVLLFYMPLQHLHVYNRLLLKLATCFDVSTVEYQKLQEGCSRYEALSVSLGRRQKEAESTNQFWKTNSGKTIDVLRRPQRRLVCESSDKSLTLQNAGRFSVNWFVLFNDLLVHAQFSSHHVYPLVTLWVEPITEEASSNLYGIKVTTPEESFTLLASSPQEKARWLRAMNQAVEAVLMGEDSGAGVPADSRTASYVFSKDLLLKDASYSGRWLSGKPHGKGTMKWPDGRTYTGTFKHGLKDGYGDYFMPNKTLNKCDRYQGHWKEGKMQGFGKYKYATGEVYEGSFHENMRQGHGMLSSGKLIGPSSSVFIGQWLQDKKTGYGVFDNMTRGEKYMGLWLEDQRHGNGVLVTQTGLYYEGAFSNNKMMGTGFLMSEDDTTFQGEFSDDWTPNGKGTLSMPHGDVIEGLFTGEWTSGLNITGTYRKPDLYDADRKERTQVLEPGRLSVPPEMKWRAVFSECWSRLGCEAPGLPCERRKAWENIAVTLTSGRRDSPKVLSRSQTRMLEKLELIPQHCGPVTARSYDLVRRYLAKACETPLHPLGWLVETLVTAYRMTYVGVGSTRRLRQQAVDEIKSFINRIFQLVRFLFPDMPEEGGFIIADPTSCVSSSWVVCSSTLLLPVLLPRLYPPLFSLYSLDKEREDSLYWNCVLRLNKQPDLTLLENLGVQQNFWPLSISVLGKKQQVLPSTKDACWASAVETLQLISTKFTPSDKLQVIRQTFEELTQEVQALFHKNIMWSMDDLFPLFLYVVLRARIKKLGSEVSLIDDLMDPSLQHGELGLMFTTLKACYFQIQQESP
uniref:Alsin Rho guanine nucleotide exchange factor ALS2 b n=1 Tax=Esox lucius TaxID=8010 RepID=A0A3P8ZXS9_ESOLU